MAKKERKTFLFDELQKRNWSASFFASKVYSTERTVLAWINGTSKPFRSMQCRISEVMDLTWDETENLFKIKK